MMTKQKKKQSGDGTTRLNLKLPALLVDELHQVAERYQQSMTAHIRSSLALSKVIYDETGKGYKIAVLDQAGNQLKELVITR